MLKGLFCLLLATYSSLFTLMSSAYANPLSEVEKEFSNAIKQVAQIKVDRHLTFEEKQPLLSALFWKTINNSKNSATAKAYLATYNGFSKNINNLLFEIIPFFLAENRPYLAKDIIQYGLDYTKDNLFVSEHVQFSAIMGEMYASIGLHNQCRALAESSNVFFQEETLFLGLDNDSIDAYNLEYKFAKQQLLLLKLKCDDSNLNSSDADVTFWLNTWPELKTLYQNDPLISFVTPNFILSQYTHLADIKKTNYNSYLQYYPKNIDLLYELFKYFYRINKSKEAGEVRELLLQWLEHNSHIVQNSKQRDNATKKMLTARLDQMSSTRLEFMRSRFDRAQILSPFYRDSINTQWYLLQQNKKLANQFSASLLAQLTFIEGKYNKHFSKGVKETDAINLKTIHARTLRGLALESAQEFEQAASLFDKNIEWAELNREQIPVEQRKFFFRSYLRESYVSSYRNRALSLKIQPNSASRLTLFLRAGDKLRSREFKDKRGIKVNEISYSLTSNQALFISADLSTHILSFWQNSSHIFIDLIAKSKNWDKDIYQIRQEIVNQEKVNSELLKSIRTPLISVFKDNFTDTQNIYTLVDGALSTLPMSYFLQSQLKTSSPLKAIQYIASLNHINKQQRNISLINTRFLGIADPIYNQKASLEFIYQNDLPPLNQTRATSLQGAFTPLPETRAEVEAIAAMINGEKKLLLGQQASKEVFIKEVTKGYQIIHFATHGILSGELPDINEPALVLTPNANSDGLLLASEIEKLILNAEVVILSACNTGNGEYFYGEEIQGLAKAFAIAGTKNLIVSLWPVDSESTVRLMTTLYKYIAQGEQVENALAKAQQDIFNNTFIDSQNVRGIKRLKHNPLPTISQHPYYWAPFILIKAN